MVFVAQFCDWLAQTPLSLMIQSTEWIIPVVQSIHILAITMVMASAVIVDLRLLGVRGNGQTLSEMTRRYFPWIWYSLIVLLLSGLVLIIAEPHRELQNSVFQAKMALLLCSVTLTAAFHISVSRRGDAWEASPGGPARARLIAIASLLLWVAIVACGRWIAYVEHG